MTKFTNTTLSGIKRTTRSYGAVQGHCAGVNGSTLLDYREAGYQIYLPVYRWVLDHCLQAELAQLQQMCQSQEVILLNVETNEDVDMLTKPLSHAPLIGKYLLNQWSEPQ